MRAARIELWVFLLALAVCPPDSWGQARSRHYWRSPQLRGLNTVGGSFARESYGLGGLRSSAAPGGSLLRSSLTRSARFNLARPSGLPAAPSLASATFSKATAQQYGTPSLKLRDLADALRSSTPSAGAEFTGFGSLDAYLKAMGRGSELRAEDDKPIESFVPSEPSIYQQHMEQGDRRFRQGEYVEAVGPFNIAAGLGRHFPEVNLSLVHVNFALGRLFTAAFHLREALTYFPELPLVRIHIRGFYYRQAEDPDKRREAKDFDKHREALAKMLPDGGGDLWLLMAYVRYFDGQEAEAVAALHEAFKRSQQDKDKAVEEAVRIYWKGLSAAGKVTGPVDGSAQPTTLPTKAAGTTPGEPPAGSQGDKDKTRTADTKGPAAP